MSNAVISVPGEQAVTTAGRYTITAQITRDGGHSIHVMLGPTPVPELGFSTPDRATASLAFRTIAEGGEQGVSPDGIRQALTDALVRDLHEVQRRRDLPSQNRVEHINALLDRLESPADTARVAELAETVRRSLADTVPAGRQPQITRSRSGVEHKPLTAPQHRIVAGHLNGVVYAGNGVAWTSLRSIARKGYAAEVRYVPGTHRVASIVLNERGHAATPGGQVEQPFTATALAAVAGPVEIAVHRGTGTYVATPAAADRYRTDIDWLPIGTVWADDDTHMIGEINGEAVAIVKTMTLVVRTAGA